MNVINDRMCGTYNTNSIEGLPIRGNVKDGFVVKNQHPIVLRLGDTKYTFTISGGFSLDVKSDREFTALEVKKMLIYKYLLKAQSIGINDRNVVCDSSLANRLGLYALRIDPITCSLIRFNLI